MVLALIIAILAIFVVAIATQLQSSAGFIGASLVSLMSISNSLTSIVTRWTQLEIAIGAVTRLESFCKTVTSEHGEAETERPPEDWPRFGSIKIKDVSASYE
jgi:ATP-binding cassette, subfamily C (CFTR/MRP), member 1